MRSNPRNFFFFGGGGGWGSYTKNFAMIFPPHNQMTHFKINPREVIIIIIIIIIIIEIPNSIYLRSCINFSCLEKR